MMVLTAWVVRKEHARARGPLVPPAAARLRAIFSYSHGTNDAQKVMGIIAWCSYGTIWADRADRGRRGEVPGPFWVVLACHAAIGLGTMFGGWRIVRTMGHSLTKLQPIGGFCAETGGGVTILALAHLGIPVSTTHTITGAIVGGRRGGRGARGGGGGGVGRVGGATILATPPSACGGSWSTGAPAGPPGGEGGGGGAAGRPGAPPGPAWDGWGPTGARAA